MPRQAIFKGYEIRIFKLFFKYYLHSCFRVCSSFYDKSCVLHSSGFVLHTDYKMTAHAPFSLAAKTASALALALALAFPAQAAVPAPVDQPYPGTIVLKV